MIEALVDHSYQDDYHSIAQINVKLADVNENKRVSKLLAENNNFGGEIFISGGDVKGFLSNALNIEQKYIDINIEEIDLY
ncbi:hypothetical protein J7J00_00255 [Bacillus sp. ISL-4]|uniref:hypothetical protein n=1 Tax=Bacillus sp. ISL-4 TaxID=2819125 RepID=UPI001BE9524D|nr:hypothetical protein [Bacillus sp. ISL-4]MBT2663943.1 hypothetical protein [Bacillus sp. ISL-4]MBT2672670.1 hypothetical protein [Streptomyces sp. ISL-14]